MGAFSSAPPSMALLLERSSDVPLHAQLYQQLREAILSGRLEPGSRLPSTRELAAELGVARNTVLNAFEQLGAEGYLEGHVGAGSYVSRDLPDSLMRVDRTSQRARRSPQIWVGGDEIELASVTIASYSGTPRPFRTSTPALDAFPYQLWSRLLMRRWRESARQLLTYGDPAGYLPLRNAVAAYLSTARGVRCQPAQLILTNGSQHALDLVARVLLRAGDEAWIEDPGFLGARTALTLAGSRLVPVPIDDEGLNVDAGIEQAPRARLAYVTPSHQYPLGATLTLRRRLSLLQWARQADAWILEDDYDSEFRYAGRPLPSLQGIDVDDRVIYVGTFSKILFPSIRTGFIVAPPPLVAAFTAARALGGHASPTLDQAVLRDFIVDGHFARHLRRMRMTYATRQRTLVKAARRELEGVLEVLPSQAGMHLMGWLPAGVDDRQACNAALRRGVEVTPLSAYCLVPQRRGALRLGYTGFSPRQLCQGVRELASALRVPEPW